MPLRILARMVATQLTLVTLINIPVCFRRQSSLKKKHLRFNIIEEIDERSFTQQLQQIVSQKTQKSFWRLEENTFNQLVYNTSRKALFDRELLLSYKEISLAANQLRTEPSNDNRINLISLKQICKKSVA